MINFKTNSNQNSVNANRRRIIKHTTVGGVIVSGLSALNSLAQSKTTPIMPTLFVGHGDPMNVISDNRFTRDWQQLGKKLPTPAAILTISAHWETTRTSVQTSSQPKQIHDFYGFPDELYNLPYPAPGAPKVAQTVVDIVTTVDIETTEDWGLDHGAWCILAKIFPAATVPVFQLSLGQDLSLQQHFKLAQELSVLRRRGVLIVGSGNIVHNMHAWHSDLQSGKGEVLHDWAIAFDETVASTIESGNYEHLSDFKKLGIQAQQSHPTLEHYAPLLYTLGSSNRTNQASFFANGFEGGSFSMRSVLIEG